MHHGSFTALQVKLDRKVVLLEMNYEDNWARFGGRKKCANPGWDKLCLDTGSRAPSHYNDLTLLQSFQPTAAQLSKKAVLPLAKILATASCRSSKNRVQV